MECFRETKGIGKSNRRICLLQNNSARIFNFPKPTEGAVHSDPAAFLLDRIATLSAGCPYNTANRNQMARSGFGVPKHNSRSTARRISMSYDPVPPDPYASDSGQRAVMPGVLLIIVGVLNILGAGCGGFMGYTFSIMPEAELQKAYDQQSTANKQALKEQNINGPEDLRRIYVVGGYGAAGLWVLGGLLPLLGGIAMCMRRARWLAIIGAVVAAIPCLSASSCALLGMAIGIWALVVLFSADVKAAFR
jgi:hypothetical protein